MRREEKDTGENCILGKYIISVALRTIGMKKCRQVRYARNVEWTGHTNYGRIVGREKPFTRPKYRWEESKEMDEILINVPLDGFQCLDCVSMEMNARFVQTAGNFSVRLLCMLCVV